MSIILCGDLRARAGDEVVEDVVDRQVMSEHKLIRHSQ